MARSTSRRRSSCATVTPPRTGRRAVRTLGKQVPRRAGPSGCGLALARTECQPSIREGRRPPQRSPARAGPPHGAVEGRDGRGRRRLGWGRRRPGAGLRGGGPPLIFKGVHDGRPYPDHGLSTRDWAMIPPRQVRLDTLTTTKRELALDALLADDSTFYGDLFPHAVQWHGELYLEDGLHRALRAALQQRNVIHVRVLDLDALTPVQAPAGPSTAAIPAQPPVPGPRTS
ncbi:type II toxin-antitoxin system VapB family antitoxin [Blastococcus saxobsidens]|uniref:type II toxin-antitoxin system VapB family antitoxin n=1 Tax=Blastococcus saxobsidens TaxID=138336 RepID=UPI003D1601DA